MLAVIKKLDVFLDRCLGLCSRLESIVVSQFIFKRPPEAIYRGIVKAVPLTLHGGLHAEEPGKP